MELLERVERLERGLKARRPELHFPSTATLEHRLRWLEIVLEEMRAKENHGVYAETLTEEKLRQLLAHTVYIKGDRITLHSLTADPASCVSGDVWFRSDLGKSKQAIDAVVANAKLLRREGDTIPAAEIASLDAAKITSGRFGMARLPDGTSGQVLTAQGAGVDPAYAAAAGGPTIVRKTADQIVNNNDYSLQNDNELFFAVAANEKWHFHFHLLTQSSTVADIMIGIAIPSGGLVRYRRVSHDAGGVLIETCMNFAAQGVPFKGTNGIYGIEFEGIIINGATAGNLQLQWCQNTAEVSDTKVLTNSCLIAHKLA